MHAAVLLLAFQPVVLPQPERIIALEGETHHVQGVVVSKHRLYLTSVDRSARKGFLFEYELPSGKRLRSVEIQDGPDRFHPGGLDLHGGYLWIPVAEYKRNSTAVIQKRSVRTLALVSQFKVNDHIGCVAASGSRLWGGNWDSRQIYEWTLDGQELSKRERASAVSYQDIKFRRGAIAASGLRAGAKSGAVEVLDPGTLKPRRVVEMGATDRGVLYTHEGMDTDGRGRYHFVPEDGPSRLFVFRIP